jgi:hypothetical protein
MAAKVKKVDVKKVAKLAVSEVIANALKEAGYTVNANHAAYGFTDGTLVVTTADTDVQVKLIAPKAGAARYAVIEDEVMIEAEAAAE